MKEEQKVIPLTRGQRRLINAAAAIMDGPSGEIDYLHSVQCQCGLPYRDPGENVREWEYRQGKASLRIEAGVVLHPGTGEYVKVGLPHGEKPRLVLIHLSTEAIRTNCPEIDVEDSMTAFARSLGIETNGDQLRRLKDQLARLAAATIRFGMILEGHAVQVNTQFVRQLDLWFPKEASQRVLWPSKVQLSQDYFDSLKRHAVPLDRRAIRALAGSAMALDVYVWMAQRLHRIPAKRPQFLPWGTLKGQFGSGYARMVDFRRQFLSTLSQVQAVYPKARWEVDERGITMKQSRPPVARHQVAVPAAWEITSDDPK